MGRQDRRAHRRGAGAAAGALSAGPASGPTFAGGRPTRCDRRAEEPRLDPALIAALQAGIDASIAAKQALRADAALLARIADTGERMADALRAGGRILFAGNGGSAADAQHLAAELVSRFAFDRPGLAALSLATDTSMLTAIGNDYGYERLFARQLEAQARRGDVFVGLTTSGRSPNVLAAFDTCRALGVMSVALCGPGGALEGRADVVLRMPAPATPRIQECHGLVGHLLCEQVERALFGAGR